MNLYQMAARVMAMDDATWLRHASGWSVWSRVVTPLPLIALAIWSRAWIGWGAGIPVALCMVWLWLNPRLFPPPRDLDGWAARGVLGELVFLHQRQRVADHHLRATRALMLASAAGLVPFAWGLAAYDLRLVVLGGVMVAGAKLWFVDRMAWVWADYLQSGGTLDALRALVRGA